MHRSDAMSRIPPHGQIFHLLSHVLDQLPVQEMDIHRRLCLKNSAQSTGSPQKLPSSVSGKTFTTEHLHPECGRVQEERSPEILR